MYSNNISSEELKYIFKTILFVIISCIINYLVPASCNYISFTAFYVSAHTREITDWALKTNQGWSFVIIVLIDKCSHAICHILSYLIFNLSMPRIVV